MPYWLINPYQRFYLGSFSSEAEAYQYFFNIYVMPYVSAHPRHWAIYRWMTSEEILNRLGCKIVQKELGEIMTPICAGIGSGQSAETQRMACEDIITQKTEALRL